jgi:hypothetical protein
MLINPLITTYLKMRHLQSDRSHPACQRNGLGRQDPQTANKTAASETSSPKVCLNANETGYRDGKNTSRADAVARANPVRDKVEERVRGCLARAHRVQLQMSPASKAQHRTMNGIANIALRDQPLPVSHSHSMSVQPLAQSSKRKCGLRLVPQQITQQTGAGGLNLHPASFLR